MENKEMFEIMLNKIEELSAENARLKLRIKFYKKYINPSSEISKEEFETTLNSKECDNNVHIKEEDMEQIADTLKKIWD